MTSVFRSYTIHSNSQIYPHLTHYFENLQPASHTNTSASPHSFLLTHQTVHDFPPPSIINIWANRGDNSIAKLLPIQRRVNVWRGDKNDRKVFPLRIICRDRLSGEYDCG